MRVWLPFNSKTFDKFHHCYNSHLFSSNCQTTFLVGKWVCLAHILVTTKFCNSHIPPKYFGKSYDIFQLSIVRFHLQKNEICSLWGELRSHHPVLSEVWLSLLPRNICKFQYFWNYVLYSSNYLKIVFCLGNGLRLTYLSVTPKFYSSSIPLCEIWRCLHPKYFGKLSHIYQIKIVKLLSIKIFGVCKFHKNL